MSAQIKPNILPGYLVTEGSRVERVISVMKDHVLLRPIHAAADDMQDVMVRLLFPRSKGAQTSIVSVLPKHSVAGPVPLMGRTRSWFPTLIGSTWQNFFRYKWPQVAIHGTRDGNIAGFLLSD